MGTEAHCRANDWILCILKQKDLVLFISALTDNVSAELLILI